MEKECPFTTSPVGFLRVLMVLRRKRQNFQKSHFGRILHDELLAKKTFSRVKKFKSLAISQQPNFEASMKSQKLSVHVGVINQ